MPHRNDDSDYQDNGKAKKDNMLKNVYNFFFLHKSAAWTAIFTGVLTIFTYKLYDVSKTATETTRAAQRASVSFAGFQVGPRMKDANNKWAGDQMSVGWYNSGETAGKNLVIQTNAKEWPVGEDLPPSYEFPLSPEKSRGVIAPKGGYQNPRVIPSNIMEDSWHGRQRFFFWGTMLYNDVFSGDPDRLTEFCVEISQITVTRTTAPVVQQAQPKTVPASTIPPPALDIASLDTGIVGFTYQACTEHNCYDQDCKDYTDRVKDMRK